MTQELDAVDKELEAALAEIPQDLEKIAALQEKQAALREQKSAVQKEIESLSQQRQEIKNARNRCDTVSSLCQSVKNRGDSKNTFPFSMQFLDQRDEHELPFVPLEPPTADQICDVYVNKMREIVENLTNLRDFMLGKVSEAKELHTENKQALQDIKQKVDNSRQNLQSIRERFNQTKKPANTHAQEAPAPLQPNNIHAKTIIKLPTLRPINATASQAGITNASSGQPRHESTTDTPETTETHDTRPNQKK